MTNKGYINLKVEGKKESIISFLHVCSIIEALCKRGSCNTIPVIVDGDGSADLSFKLVAGEMEESIMMTKLPVNIDKIPEIWIGK